MLHPLKTKCPNDFSLRGFLQNEDGLFSLLIPSIPGESGLLLQSGLCAQRPGTALLTRVHVHAGLGTCLSGMTAIWNQVASSLCAYFWIKEGRAGQSRMLPHILQLPGQQTQPPAFTGQPQ